MKSKVTFFWAALMLLMLAPLKSWADNGPYAQLTGTTLTFAVGDYTPAEGSCWANPGSDWYGPASDVPWYSQRATVTAVVFDASYATARPTYIKYWFNGMSELTSITGMKEYLNTSEVAAAGAYALFAGCSKLTSVDVSGFDMSKINDLSRMFASCKALETITGIEGWNTSSVTNMYNMFYGCETLESLDLSGWDVSKVQTFSGMFNSCTSLTSLDLSGGTRPPPQTCNLCSSTAKTSPSSTSPPSTCRT